MIQQSIDTKTAFISDRKVQKPFILASFITSIKKYFMGNFLMASNMVKESRSTSKIMWNLLGSLMGAVKMVIFLCRRRRRIMRGFCIMGSIMAVGSWWLRTMSTREDFRMERNMVSGNNSIPKQGSKCKVVLKRVSIKILMKCQKRERSRSKHFLRNFRGTKWKRANHMIWTST